MQMQKNSEAYNEIGQLKTRLDALCKAGKISQQTFKNQKAAIRNMAEGDFNSTYNNVLSQIEKWEAKND